MLAQWGTRFVKIVRVQHNRKFDATKPEDRVTNPRYINSAAWAFVDRTNGDVLKPASWNAPAKHARGNILDGQNGLGSIGPYGPAYLR